MWFARFEMVVSALKKGKAEEEFRKDGGRFAILDRLSREGLMVVC